MNRIVIVNGVDLINSVLLVILMSFLCPDDSSQIRKALLRLRRLFY